jgi:predicted  nucleic acid-binding Zn-ribbon protein
MNPLLFLPTLIKRALDDLSAIADAARRLPGLEEQVLDRIDTISGKALADLAAVRRGIEGLEREMAPIRELPAVRAAVEPLDGRMLTMEGQLEALRSEVKPISQLKQVREGIEPLDEDMRAVRLSVDHLEPLIVKLNERLEALHRDLAPLGELADKIPGVGR